VPDAFADVLVERDGVPEPGTSGVRRGCEKAIICRMAAIDIWVGDATENGEIVAMILQSFEVGRQRVTSTAFLWKELFWQEPKIITDAKHATRFPAGSLIGRDAIYERRERWRHRLKHRQ